MDRFSDMLLAESGMLVMKGKAEQGEVAIQAIQKNGAVSQVAVGGASYLIAKSMDSARIRAFVYLGIEAIYEYVVNNMQVSVAFDSVVNSIHQQGPQQWQRIASVEE